MPLKSESYFPVPLHLHHIQSLAKVAYLSSATFSKKQLTKTLCHQSISMHSFLLLSRASFIIITTQLFVILFLSSISLHHHHYFHFFLTTSSYQPQKGSPILIDPLQNVPVGENGGGVERCQLGYVYVYELPPEFNHEIVKNCHELNPWSLQCENLQNNGFGKSAGEELAGYVPGGGGEEGIDLASSWYSTDQFVSEIIFHNKLLSHKCRTLDPESATAFYIPFYAGLAVGKYLWSTRFSSRDRDKDCESLSFWLGNQTHWQKSDGWNHFLTMGRISWDFRRSEDHEWGSSCIHMPFMRNVTRLLIERNPWDYFDIGVPYPTGFHPRTVEELSAWQSFVRNQRRKTLFTFAGAKRRKFRDDFRGLLLRQCLNESSTICRVVDCSGTRCSNGTSEVIKAFLDTKFCLQPRGDSFTRRSIFDCMIAGAIPVFFWHRSAYLQYQWFLPDQPKLIYSKPNEGLGSVKDAFDVSIDGVLQRIKDQQQPVRYLVA